MDGEGKRVDGKCCRVERGDCSQGWDVRVCVRKSEEGMIQC